MVPRLLPFKKYIVSDLIFNKKIFQGENFFPLDPRGNFFSPLGRTGGSRPKKISPLGRTGTTVKKIFKGKIFFPLDKFFY